MKDAECIHGVPVTWCDLCLDTERDKAEDIRRKMAAGEPWATDSAWADSRERTKRSVARAREELVAQLGGKCAACSSTKNLCFDHKKKRTWRAPRANRHTRMARYKREAKAGKLQLLCKSCNSKRGVPGTKQCQLFDSYLKK